MRGKEKPDDLLLAAVMRIAPEHRAKIQKLDNSTQDKLREDMRFRIEDLGFEYRDLGEDVRKKPLEEVAIIGSLPFDESFTKNRFLGRVLAIFNAADTLKTTLIKHLL